MPKKTSHPGWLYLNLACSNSKYPGCHLLHSSSIMHCTNKLENWLTESRAMLFYCVSWLSSNRQQARGVNLKCLAIYLRPRKVKVGQAHSVSMSFPVGLSSTFLSEKRTKTLPDWLSHLDSLMNKPVIVGSCPVCTVRSSNPGKAIKISFGHIYLKEPPAKRHFKQLWTPVPEHQPRVTAKHIDPHLEYQ